MRVTLILWITLLSSAAVAYHEITEAQIQTLSDGQVIRSVKGQKEVPSIYLGHTWDEPRRVILVQFGKSVRTGSSVVLPSYVQAFRSIFSIVHMHYQNGVHPIRGGIDLRIKYLEPKLISIPDENLILDSQKMVQLKEATSVVLVNRAFERDVALAHNDEVITFGRPNFPQKGQVVWVSSKKLFAGHEGLKHPFHFAIFLGFAELEYGSIVHKIKIAQIVMNLPIVPSIPRKRRGDFNDYFPTTWWCQDPRILLDGDIDLAIHEIDQENILIPNTRLILDVEKLERHMVELTQYPTLPPGRSSSLPPERVLKNKVSQT